MERYNTRVVTDPLSSLDLAVARAREAEWRGRSELLLAWHCRGPDVRRLHLGSQRRSTHNTNFVVPIGVFGSNTARLPSGHTKNAYVIRHRP